MGLYSDRVIKIFAEQNLDKVLSDQQNKLRSEVEQKPDDYILNVNQTEYVNYLVAQYSVHNLDLKFEDQFITTYEQEIPAERFPPMFNVRSGKRYKRDIIRYHIPFTGEEELLRCRPNSYMLWTQEVILEDNCLCFDIIQFQDNPETIRRQADNIIEKIRQNQDRVVQQVEVYNKALPSQSRNIFEARKQHLLKKHNMLAALGVPIRKRDDLPQTFAVPNPHPKKVHISAPVVTERGYVPEPTIDPVIYQDILSLIHNVGKQLERTPSVYEDKHEEDLRDYILLFLQSQFQGSATGETFNKSGKTDILLRYENSNVFIAECKFWSGPKKYLETITQLLNYLTWRDSKAAVVIFVRNKTFSSVIQTVEESTPNHPNHLGFVNKHDDTWLNFRFHINEDRNREVKLAVLLFAVPSINKDKNDR